MQNVTTDNPKDLSLLMKNIFLPLMLVGFFLQVTIAHATGNELLARCNLALVERGGARPLTNAENLDAVYCIGFVRGIKNTLSLATLAEPDLKIRACIPDSVTSLQAIRVITKYFEEHPEKLHEDDFFLSITALIEAFPCD